MQSIALTTTVIEGLKKSSGGWVIREFHVIINVRVFNM